MFRRLLYEIRRNLPDYGGSPYRESAVWGSVPVIRLVDRILAAKATNPAAGTGRWIRK